MAVAPETTRQSPTTLVELIGRDTLQSIQDAFATAFDIPTVILDHEGRNVNEITFRVRFCEDLTRPSAAGERCLSCDVAAMRESEATRRPTTFRCWAGLNDSTVPIVSSDGRLFGHFLAGQVHYEAPDSTERWRDLAREIGLDEDDYEAAAREVHVIPEAVYRHRIDCLGILARMIADQASAALSNRALLDDALSANERTRRMTEELEAIASGVSLISGGDDLLPTLTRLVEAAREVVPFDGAAVFLERSGDARVEPILIRDDGLVDPAAYRGGADSVRDAADAALLEAGRTLAIPLVLDGEPLGSVVLRRHAPAAFSAHDRDLLTIVGGQVATAVGVANLRDGTERVLAVALARDAELREMAAEVDGDAILKRLLDQAVVSLDAADAALLPRNPETPAVLRAAATGRAQRLGAALEGALARARSTGRPAETRFVDDETALIVPAAAVGDRDGYDLVIWRAAPWSELDRTLAHGVAAGVEFVADAERRRGIARRGAARQRALSALVSHLRATRTSAGAEGLIAEAAGFPRVLRVERGDIEGVLVVRDPDSPAADPVHALALDGRAELRPPDADADAGRWDGWAARVVAAIGPADGEPVCAPCGGDDASLVALIGLGASGRRDELAARLAAVGDLLALGDAPAAAEGAGEARFLLVEQVHFAARRGRSAVEAAADEARRALGGDAIDPETAARLATAERDALALADDLDRAARDRAEVARRVDALAERAAALEADDGYAHELMRSATAREPVAAVCAAIAGRRGCSARIDDASGWPLGGAEAVEPAVAHALEGGGTLVLGDEGVAPTAWELRAAEVAAVRGADIARREQAERGAIAEALVDAEELGLELAARCDAVGFDARSTHRVCVVDVGADEVDDAVRALHAWCGRAGAPALVGRRDGRAIVVGPADADWYQGAVDALTGLGLAVHAGLGHPAVGAPGTKRSHASARQAAEVLRVTERTGVLEIQDDSLESILVEAAEPARLVRFVESVLNPISSYDERKGSELMRSLETAVGMGWNLHGAARACHVHVSTFRYRLTRIEQLTGLDLATADGRLAAELALRARRALG